MLVLIIDAFLKQVINFFKIGKGVNVGNLILFGVVVLLAVVQLMIIAHCCL